MGLFSGKSARNAFMYAEGKLNEARLDNNRAIQAGKVDSLAALGRGYDAARGSYGDAIEYYRPYATTGGKAFDMYADAIGVNGDEGYQRAVGSYRASPGYERRVSGATDAVARKQSALGALGSGNTMQAITDRASYLADEDYDQHLSRLDGMGKMGYAATGSMADLTRGIGDLSAQQGQGEANIITNAAGQQVNHVWSATNPLVSARMGVSNAGSQASANAWGLGMNLANLGAGLLGGGGLTSLFGKKGGTGQFEYPQNYGGY